MVDLSAPAARVVPGYKIGPNDGLTAVGRRWLEYDGSDDLNFYRGWINHRTGTATAPSEDNAAGERHAPDLDAEVLEQRLCSPVRRPRDPKDDGNIRPVLRARRTNQRLARVPAT